jgi:hypothetical protein
MLPAISVALLIGISLLTLSGGVNPGDISSILANNPDLKKNVLTQIETTPTKPTSNQEETREIGGYIVYQYTLSAPQNRVAMITCLDFGGTAVGDLIFLKDDATIVENSFVNGYIYLNYPYSRYNDILAILENRTSKTVKLYINPLYPEWGDIELRDEAPSPSARLE